MNTLSYTFVVLLGLMLTTQLGLGQRHIRYIIRRRGRVPTAFRQTISLAAHRKAADYTVSRTQIGQIEDIINAGFLLVLTFGGLLNILDRYWAGHLTHPIWSGTALIVSVFVIQTLLGIPFTLYRVFGIEERFGFNRTTPALFLVDFSKGALIALLLGVPLVLAVLWLMHQTGYWWWLYAWGVWMGFNLFMVWAYPNLISPLFNKYKPLRKTTLRKRLQGLLKRTGFKSKGILVVDSSKRTTHGNAYFTGFGRSKRIVFFDNLLKSLGDTEVEAVVAHELGHFKLNHIVKGILLMAGLSLLGLALLGWLIGKSWFYQGFSIDQPSVHMALILFLLMSPVFTFFLNPFLTLRSRTHEYEADAFAAEQANAGALIRALIKLYKENATTLTPDPWHSAFYDSHPPALARIAQLKVK
jgi:STE24 endopeptidase